MKFSIIDHVKFYDGYFDAVGRIFTTNEILIAPVVRVIGNDESIESLLSAKVVSLVTVEKMAVSFEKDISVFLGKDPRERLLFYLVDYFDWFDGFSETCICTKFELSGNDVPEKYLAYIISCNNEIDILVYLYEKAKS